MSEEHLEPFDDQPVFWRTAPGEDGRAPILYVHGVPTNSDLWEPFLTEAGGIAVDLPGFGRTTKRGDLHPTIPYYADWLGRFLDEVAQVDRIRLVVQDWGAGAGLGLAMEQPDRIERLVVLNSVPLLPGYRWHRTARLWRTPFVGGTMMGANWRWLGRLATREAIVRPGPMPDEFIRLCWDHFDYGTQRAILRLYRWADPEVLAAAGARLGDIRAPTLVLWGGQDPYIPAEFAALYGDALGAEEVEVLPDASHWPWYDRPDVVGRVAAFLGRRGAGDGPHGPAEAGPS